MIPETDGRYGGYDTQEFISEVYDAEYSGPGIRRGDDAGFYLDCSRRAGGRTLELGCGTGRVLLPTARAGCAITGFDLSSFMLDKCRKKLAAEPKEVRQRVKLVQGNMTQFDTGEKHALVTIPFRPFQHLITVKEQRGCLECARRQLSPEGLLVFDVFNPRLDMLSNPKHLIETEDLPERVLADGRRVRRNSRLSAFHRELQYNDVELIYYIDYPDGRRERLVQTFPMRYFFRYELENLLELCGFNVVDLFGNFDRSPFSGESPEMIFVAKPKS